MKPILILPEFKLLQNRTIPNTKNVILTVARTLTLNTNSLGKFYLNDVQNCNF